MPACVDAPHLHGGQTLDDAQAVLPERVLRPANPPGETDLLRRLGHWALRFTPAVALEAPDELILDVSGCTGLFGGEAAMLARMGRCFRHAGYRAWAGMAGNPDPTAAVVQAGRRDTVVPAGGDMAALAPLPVAALRLPGEVAEGLARLGLLRLDGRVHRVLHAAGPERLKPERWGDRLDLSWRDYFRVQTEGRPAVGVPPRNRPARCPGELVVAVAALGHAGVGICDTNSLAGRCAATSPPGRPASPTPWAAGCGWRTAPST